MRSRGAFAAVLLLGLASVGVRADSEEDVAIAEELAFGATGMLALAPLHCCLGAR